MVQSTTLSTEMIANQYNDGAVNRITGIFQSLMDIMNSRKIDCIKLHKDRNARRLYSELDAVIEERFGIPCRHSAAKGTPYAVYTQAPTNFNVLNKNLESTHKSLKDYLKITNTTDKNTIRGEDVLDARKDQMSVLHSYSKSIDKVNASLVKNPMYVDIKNAKIRNVPEGFLISFISDLGLLINEGDLKANELTAVLLHEIGHAFTHLEYAVRTVINTSVILDSVTESVEVRNKSFPESIKIAYQDMGGDPKEIKDANLNTGMVKLITKYTEASLSMGDNTHGYTDSEQLADQFAGRFGVGAALAEGLHKIRTNFDEISRVRGMESAVLSVVMTLVYTLLITGSWFITAVLPLVVAVGYLLAVLVVEVVTGAFTAGGITEGSVYDTDDNRLKRIKNELVRQLRLGVIPKKDVTTQIASVERIEQLISVSKTDDDSTSVIQRFFRTVTVTGRTLVETKKIDQLLEDLMENDLHVAGRKLQSIGA